MKRNKLIGLIIVVLLVTSVPAFAETGVALSVPSNQALAETGRFSIGLEGGWALSTADEALWGQEDTVFDINNPVYGAGLMYWFPSGFAMELAFEHLEFDVKDSGYELGTLTMTPVMVLVKAQGMPRKGRGFTGHLEIGGGVNFARFDQGPSTTESGFDFSVDIDERSLFFAAGAGVDYFITRNLSLSLNARWLAGEIESTWYWSEPGKPEDEDLLFLIYDLQGLLGIRYWF